MSLASSPDTPPDSHRTQQSTDSVPAFITLLKHTLLDIALHSELQTGRNTQNTITLEVLIEHHTEKYKVLGLHTVPTQSA